MVKKIKFLLFLLRTKGPRYTYNRLWHGIMRSRHDGLINRLFFVKLFPLFGSLEPRLVEVEVTTRCHLKCTMCEHTYWNESGKDMAFEDFKKIIDQLPKLKWIGLSGIGSSFLNKDFMKMMRYVKEKSRGAINIELFDTFTLIDRKKSDEIVDIGVDIIFVSIDGATKETYEKIRVGANFDKVLENIKGLFDAKKEKKSFFPQVAFHYIISKDNLHEVTMFVDLVAERFGAENIHHIFFTSVLHEFEQIKGLMTEVPDDIVEEASKRGERHCIPVTWNKNVPTTKKLAMSECTAWIEPFIFVDGTVVQCCATHEQNQRGVEVANSFGNIFKESFKDIWHGKRYREFRSTIHSGKIPRQCEHCPVTNPNR